MKTQCDHLNKSYLVVPTCGACGVFGSSESFAKRNFDPSCKLWKWRDGESTKKNYVAHNLQINPALIKSCFT